MITINSSDWMGWALQGRETKSYRWQWQSGQKKLEHVCIRNASQRFQATSAQKRIDPFRIKIQIRLQTSTSLTHMCIFSRCYSMNSRVWVYLVISSWHFLQAMCLQINVEDCIRGIESFVGEFWRNNVNLMVTQMMNEWYPRGNRRSHKSSFYLCNSICNKKYLGFQ